MLIDLEPTLSQESCPTPSCYAWRREGRVRQSVFDGVDVADAYHCLLWKPVNVPSARSLDVLHNELQPVKVQGSDGVKRNVEQNEGPFEESVDGVC